MSMFGTMAWAIQLLGWQGCSDAEAMPLLAVPPLPVKLMSWAGKHLLAAGSICHDPTFYVCREIVFEFYDSDIPEPRWLQQARARFNATLAAAANTRRRALLMCLHRRCATMHATDLVTELVEERALLAKFCTPLSFCPQVCLRC
jgi:hypothetical protein